MITTITPTGDRPLAFALCQNWIKKQTLQPEQWIVIDDGKIPMKPFVSMEYVRREPQPGDPRHTLLLNLKTALPLIKGNKILIIEDDEYYAQRYIEAMVHRLDRYEIVGIGASKYYHLPTGSYYVIGNQWHASLAQTAFCKSLLPLFEMLIDTTNNYLDIEFWKHIKGTRRGHIFFDKANQLYVGMKGLPGRHGIGVGHNPNFIWYKRHSRDLSREVLRQWIRDNDDYNIYMDIITGKLTERNYQSCLKI